MRLECFIHYKKGNKKHPQTPYPYVFFRIQTKYYRKDFRLWQAIDPKFYRYGLFIKYGVRGWDRRLPPIVHNMTKWYYTRKLRKEYDF